MNKNHRLAIELKYEGMTYKRISKLLDRKFTAGTLKKYFSRNGMLYNEYINYVNEHNQIRMQEASVLIKRSTRKAAEAITGTLEKAIRENKYNIVLKSAQVILDRAGMPTPRWTKEDGLNNEEKKVLSDEEYERQLLSIGIDPRTGRRIGIPPITKQVQKV